MRDLIDFVKNIFESVRNFVYALSILLGIGGLFVLWQEREISVINLECKSSKSDSTNYFRISKRRQVEHPEYLSVMSDWLGVHQLVKSFRALMWIQNMCASRLQGLPNRNCRTYTEI